MNQNRRKAIRQSNMGFNRGFSTRQNKSDKTVGDGEGRRELFNKGYEHTLSLRTIVLPPNKFHLALKASTNESMLLPLVEEAASCRKSR